MSEGFLGLFNVNNEIDRLAPHATAAKRRAETLVKTDGLRVVLVTMLSGASLQEHSAPGPITIHALRGTLVVTFDDEKRELGAGDVVSLAPGVRHAVEAASDGAFLLTIGGVPG